MDFKKMLEDWLREKMGEQSPDPEPDADVDDPQAPAPAEQAKIDDLYKSASDDMPFQRRMRAVQQGGNKAADEMQVRDTVAEAMKAAPAPGDWQELDAKGNAQAAARQSADDKAPGDWHELDAEGNKRAAMRQQIADMGNHEETNSPGGTEALALTQAKPRRRGFDANFMPGGGEIEGAAMQAGTAKGAGKRLRNAPSAPGVSIGERSNATLDGEEQPGIGLEMTPDRHASLNVDDGQNQEPGDPAEGQVSNKALADAVNLAGPGSEPKDAAAHSQATIANAPPQDQSAYLAALKEVQASAFRSIGQDAPKDGLYDTLIKSNQGEQHDYKAQVAAALKQKYASDEKGLDRAEKAREFGIREQENTNYRNALLKQGDRRLDQGDRRIDKVNLKVDGIDERMYTKMAAAAGGKLPSAGEVASLNDVLAQLDDGGPQGSGYFMNKDGWQSFLRSPKGAAFRQAVLSVINPHIKRQHGATVTPGEEERAMGQFGYGSFNSPQELDSGMRRLAMEQQKNINQIVSTIPPEARAKLESWGGVPQVDPSAGVKPRAGREADTDENFAPNQILPTKLGMADWVLGGDDINNAVNDWITKRMSPQEALQRAKAMDDEEERKRARPQP
ncbi:MAG: hypothetical protein IPJ65_38130 [Archangiaceae bacterium]|nr:hypothetical protein [Archangiaceae bacterium]